MLNYKYVHLSVLVLHAYDRPVVWALLGISVCRRVAVAGTKGVHSLFARKLGHQYGIGPGNLVFAPHGLVSKSCPVAVSRVPSHIQRFYKPEPRRLVLNVGNRARLGKLTEPPVNQLNWLTAGPKAVNWLKPVDRLIDLKRLKLVN